MTAASHEMGRGRKLTAVWVAEKVGGEAMQGSMFPRAVSMFFDHLVISANMNYPKQFSEVTKCKSSVLHGIHQFLVSEGSKRAQLHDEQRDEVYCLIKAH